MSTSREQRAAFFARPPIPDYSVTIAGTKYSCTVDGPGTLEEFMESIAAAHGLYLEKGPDKAFTFVSRPAHVFTPSPLPTRAINLVHLLALETP